MENADDIFAAIEQELTEVDGAREKAIKAWVRMMLCAREAEALRMADCYQWQVVRLPTPWPASKEAREFLDPYLKRLLAGEEDLLRKEDEHG